MPKMTKAQAKRRLNEAQTKVKAVYVGSGHEYAVSTADMAAIEKIISKCLKRLN
jgi:hypothetical protein